MPVSEEVAEEAVLRNRLRASPKGCGLGGLGCVLFSFVHLLLELFCLLLVDKTQRGQAFFQLEGVKKSSVLVVIPGVENLLVPNDSPVRWLSNNNSFSQHLWFPITTRAMQSNI